MAHPGRPVPLIHALGYDLPLIFTYRIQCTCTSKTDCIQRQFTLQNIGGSHRYMLGNYMSLLSYADFKKIISGILSVSHKV